MGDRFGTARITVNPDTDELIVMLSPETAEPGGGDWVDVDVLADCVGHEIGWWWSSISSQGYWDTFMLSFETAVPNVAFFGIASQVEVMRMEIVSPEKRNRGQP